MLTFNSTYKIKSKNKQLDFNTMCNELKSMITNMLNTDKFNDTMSAISNEFTTTIESIEQPQVELITTLFVTLVDNNEPANKLFRKYMEDNLLRIEHEQFSARLVKRRIY